jgi:hypothetical protein
LICDRGRELEERWDTKRFDGWAFQYSFWDFVEGRVISEVDVEGVCRRNTAPYFAKLTMDTLIRYICGKLILKNSKID